MFICSNKDKVFELLFDTIEILLKYIYTKWMDRIQVIGVYIDIPNTDTLFY